jgi:hypothetical protein
VPNTDGEGLDFKAIHGKARETQLVDSQMIVDDEQRNLN